jgi:hypothetical protein
MGKTIRTLDAKYTPVTVEIYLCEMKNIVGHVLKHHASPIPHNQDANSCHTV